MARVIVESAVGQTFLVALFLIVIAGIVALFTKN
jgi:hypothetical protein